MISTKIICTIGPVSDSTEMLEEMNRAGMNIARLNMSHGSHESHKKVIDRVKEINSRNPFPIAVLLDTQGPEIRTGYAEIDLQVGKEVRVTVPPTDEHEPNTLHVNYRHLVEEVRIGSTIAVDSGLINLKVVSKEEHSMMCKVIDGGYIKGRRHVNLPGTAVKLPSVTDKDKEDIIFGTEQGIDGIALSFVRNTDTIRKVREILGDKSKSIKLIAKIENQEGVENLESIVQAADGIMVARGDLGIEIPMEELPQIQRKIAYLCAKHGKILIVATHLLESMIEHPMPTRAEITDVANAVYEQADAIMLSGETTVGKYPVKSVETLAKVAKETEKYPGVQFTNKMIKTSNRQYLAESASRIAMERKHKGIVVLTRRGRSAVYLASCRPKNLRLYCFSNTVKTLQTLVFYRAVVPYLIPFTRKSEERIQEALQVLQEKEGFEPGDQVIVLCDILTSEGYVPSLQMRTIS